ncbi:MAG: hypothetical protein O7F12_04065 [Nitrospirae bacterium]|nr:hypothetical protein [Nitrospirota bacterium]
MNEIVPLSRKIELRPRGTSDNSTGELLQKSINHIATSLTRLGEIADRACREDNPVMEAALRAKLADLGTRLLSLQRNSLAKEPPMSQEDLPDWSAFPEDVREYFEKGFQWMEKKYGEDALHQMMILRD